MDRRREHPLTRDRRHDGARRELTDYHPGWFPIACSPGGRDFLCIDLAPSEGGVRGQIIEYLVDEDERYRVASSFADLLSLYFEQIQTGEIDLSHYEEEE
ncbi:MAG: SMI1/KNR4 family protein [Myxococcota bacterium]